MPKYFQLFFVNASIVKTIFEPATASFVTYSPDEVPSTPISICFVPFFPFRYSSNTLSIPVLPIISFISYLSFFALYSSPVIFPAYPNMCDATVPDVYFLTGSTTIFILPNYHFLFHIFL